MWANISKYSFLECKAYQSYSDGRTIKSEVLDLFFSFSVINNPNLILDAKKPVLEKTKTDNISSTREDRACYSN